MPWNTMSEPVSNAGPAPHVDCAYAELKQSINPSSEHNAYRGKLKSRICRGICRITFSGIIPVTRRHSKTDCGIQLDDRPVQIGEPRVREKRKDQSVGRPYPLPRI